MLANQPRCFFVSEECASTLHMPRHALKLQLPDPDGLYSAQSARPGRSSPEREACQPDRKVVSRCPTPLGGRQHHRNIQTRSQDQQIPGVTFSTSDRRVTSTVIDSVCPDHAAAVTVPRDALLPSPGQVRGSQVKNPNMAGRCG